MTQDNYPNSFSFNPVFRANFLFEFDLIVPSIRETMHYFLCSNVRTNIEGFYDKQYIVVMAVLYGVFQSD